MILTIVNGDVNDYVKGDIRALVIVNDEGVCDEKGVGDCK